MNLEHVTLILRTVKIVHRVRLVKLVTVHPVQKESFHTNQSLCTANNAMLAFILILKVLPIVSHAKKDFLHIEALQSVILVQKEQEVVKSIAKSVVQEIIQMLSIPQSVNHVLWEHFQDQAPLTVSVVQV